MSSMNGAPQKTTYRKLKTVLFADVAGYGRLTEANEELTHSNLCARFSLISKLIHHHNGVIHRTEGDSVLATFSAATSALQCAIDIQAASSEQNNCLNDGESLNFRIGINCGEVLIDSGEAFGNCVNIAKRLESIAKPGEVIFSETFFTHVHYTLPYKYKYLGKRHLKNLSQSIKVYSIQQPIKPSSTDYAAMLSYRTKNHFLPASALALSIIFSLFLAFDLDFRTIQTKKNDAIAFSDAVTQKANEVELVSYNKDILAINTPSINHINQNHKSIYKSQAKFNTYEDIQNKLVSKYEKQAKLLASFEKQNKKLLSQQTIMAENFLRIEKKLAAKQALIESYNKKNNILIEANRTLLTKLDNVISQQPLHTYENLYVEYNPVRQQIIDIIESRPEVPDPTENKLNCSIYSNEAAKPHTPDGAKGTVREELQCVETKNEHVPIPQSKLAEPTRYKKELIPKEKKVVIYAYVPKFPHQTLSTTNLINKSIVKLYKNALSSSSLQSYKTNFVLLSPPVTGNKLADLDIEHCNVYKADYVASVRVNNSQTNSNLPVSSALVIHNCNTGSFSKRNTRHLLSDWWNDDGSLYLTPSTLDSFNVQVNSIVELALNQLPPTELEL